MDWFFGLLLLLSIAVWAVTSSRLRRRAEVLAKRNEQLMDERESLRVQRQLAEANLQIILSSMQEGVLVLDKRRTIRLANPAAQKLFDWTGEMSKRPVLDVLREPAVDDLIASALESGEPREAEIESAGRRNPLVLEVHVTPMRDAAGEPAALAMFRDVARLKRLEDVRREFVANVSHELRTPLSVFQGYVEHLIDEPDMPRQRQAEVFGVLRKHSKRLNALVEDLLILARLESRPDELEPELIDLPGFLRELKRDWELRAGEKGVAVQLEVAAELDPLHADRRRIEQVFTNLLDNALKYTSEGGTITLGASRVGPMMELWVKDTGQGILSSHLPHIFERFYRADKARSREVGGTGLGLSIVKHIARAHGGSVDAGSTVGKGTTIRVRLPAGEFQIQPAGT
jgi:two-component system phosphate regulon sensor histidine kinase PhoR